VSGLGTAGRDPYKQEELNLRKREIRYTGIGLLIQCFVVLLAAVATGAAAYASAQAARAVDVSAQGMEQQADANRLSTAISAIGTDQAAERVGGFALLRRHVEGRVKSAVTPEERLDAYNLYTTALEVLGVYLRNPPEASTTAAKEPTATKEPTAGLGFGHPEIPYDNKYAARELWSLLMLKPDISSLRSSLTLKVVGPKLDLANVQLAGQSWEGIDFSWLDAHFFRSIDLRGANLRYSHWGASSHDRASFLDGAHLQCANLEGADLRNVSLIGADLRGAHLKDADFTGAIFTDAQHTKILLDGATTSPKTKGLPESPQPGVSRADDGIGKDGVKDGIDTCFNYQPYWDKPAAVPAADRS
jgi:hypothetical protein